MSEEEKVKTNWDVIVGKAKNRLSGKKTCRGCGEGFDDLENHERNCPKFVSMEKKSKKESEKKAEEWEKRKNEIKKDLHAVSNSENDKKYKNNSVIPEMKDKSYNSGNAGFVLLIIGLILMLLGYAMSLDNEECVQTEYTQEAVEENLDCLKVYSQK